MVPLFLAYITPAAPAAIKTRIAITKLLSKLIDRHRGPSNSRCTCVPRVNHCSNTYHKIAASATYPSPELGVWQTVIPNMTLNFGSSSDSHKGRNMILYIHVPFPYIYIYMYLHALAFYRLCKICSSIWHFAYDPTILSALHMQI